MAEKKTEAKELSVVERKTQLFQEFLDTRKISGFAKQYAGENGEVVIYRSNLGVKDASIPFMILLDNSVYTLMQFELAAGAVKKESREKLALYFNDLNNQYRMLKFTEDDAGNVILSVSIPAGADKFDSDLVIALVDQVKALLTEELDNLKKKINE